MSGKRSLRAFIRSLGSGTVKPAATIISLVGLNVLLANTLGFTLVDSFDFLREVLILSI